MHSALYQGWVRHRRTDPVTNEFRYPLAMLYLDLDELPRLFEREPLWSYERPNLAWFRRADYLGDPNVPLDESVRALVAERTGSRPTGPIRMLTQVRMLGYVFNPVTFYYCFDADGAGVHTIVAEITNTPWLERHAYVLCCGTTGRSRQRFRFPKTFHVSPFLPMDIEHDWRFREPGERLHVHMEDHQDGRTVLDATLGLKRMPLGRKTLTRFLLRRPLLTLKVTVAIYVQALRLWWKRCPFHAHPRRVLRREEGPSHEPIHAYEPPVRVPGAGTARLARSRTRSSARAGARIALDS